MINQHQTIKDNIAKYTKPNPLADFLIPLIGDKKRVKILDVGSGPYSIIGSYLDGVSVDISHIDNQDFTDFYKKYNVNSIIKVHKKDMQNLDYLDETFDIVVCINALDHTINPPMAIEEMIRVCKPGGWIYIDCHLDQLSTGHKHKWNAKESGIITNNKVSFDLEAFGFKIQFIDNGGESRYNRIIATLQKGGV